MHFLPDMLLKSSGTELECIQASATDKDLRSPGQYGVPLRPAEALLTNSTSSMIETTL